MSIVERSMTRACAVDLVTIGEGSLRSSAIIRELLEDKLVLRPCQALMTRVPLEADEEWISIGHLFITLGKIEHRRLLTVKVSASCMPRGEDLLAIVVDHLYRNLCKARRELTITQTSVDDQILWTKVGHQVCCCQTRRDTRHKLQHRIGQFLSGLCKEAITLDLQTQASQK